MVLAKENVAEIEPAYERALLEEVDRIASVVPAEDLAVQWDTPWEVRAWDGSLPRFLVQPWFADAKKGIIDRLVRLGSRVPTGAQLGYDLCHGDYEHTGNLILGLGGTTRGRFLRKAGAGVLREFSVRVAGPPKDMRTTVDMATGLLAETSRPIDFMHLPVPRAAAEDYFRPLADFQAPVRLDVYLGLIHYSDGVQGAHRRIAAAERFIEEFGVSTECGWGRRDPTTIDGLIDIHREVSEPLRRPAR